MRAWSARAIVLGLVVGIVLQTAVAQQDCKEFHGIARCPKEFVVVIPSYNNEKYVEKNLRSVLDQDYAHFEVVYINDASTDKTGEVVSQVLATHPRGKSVRVITNTVRQGAGLNRYQVFHTIADHKIIVECDGDDWFAHTGVLTRINKEYQDPAVWLTYGQFRREPGGSIGQSKPLPDYILANHAYRFDGYYTSMLRTYYAGLYKKIWLQDILAGGKPFSTGTDLAVMIPMVEMAGSHCRYIDEVLYIVNRSSDINTEKVVSDEQRAWNDRIIRQYKRRYEPLCNLALVSAQPAARVHAIFFSEKTPTALAALLTSCRDLICDIRDITVLYKADECTREEYALVRSAFCDVAFIPLAEHTSGACLKQTLLAALGRVSADYTLLGSDQSIFVRSCCIADCVRVMRQTFAHGFYLRQEVNVPRPWAERKLLPPFITLRDRDVASSIYGWQFTAGGEHSSWYTPLNAEMVIYPTGIARTTISSMVFDTFDIMRYVWARIIDFDGIGLCFGRAVAVNNPHAILQLCTQVDSYTAYDAYYGGDAIAPRSSRVGKLWQRATRYVSSLINSLARSASLRS